MCLNVTLCFQLVYVFCLCLVAFDYEVYHCYDAIVVSQLLILIVLPEKLIVFSSLGLLLLQICLSSGNDFV